MNSCVVKYDYTITQICVPTHKKKAPFWLRQSLRKLCFEKIWETVATDTLI